MTRAMLIAGVTLLSVFAGCREAGDAAGGTEEYGLEVASEVDEEHAASVLAERALMDPNEATRGELLSIPGMNEEAAAAVIAARPHDDMLSVDAALAEGLNRVERAAVYEHLWMPIDLNNASAEVILLIPGIGARRLEIIESYRPYEGVDDFRREISKHVDDETVAIWEKYIATTSAPTGAPNPTSR